MVWAACCQAQSADSGVHSYEQVEIVQEAEPDLGDAEVQVGITPRLLGRSLSRGKRADPRDLQTLASIMAELMPEPGLAVAALVRAKNSFNWWLAPEEMQWQRTEVTRLVSKFCEDLTSGATVEPAAEDIDVLWTRCEGLAPCLLSAIIAERLMLASEGGSAWQSCYRTLCVLEHWYAKGGAARVVAEGALAMAGSMLSSILSRAPECRLKLLRFLLTKLDTDGHSGKARELEAKLDELGLLLDAFPEEFKRRL